MDAVYTDNLMPLLPQTPNAFVGNDDPDLPMFYLDEWNADSPQCLLFNGKPGLGKTTAAYIIGNYLGLDIVEYNASDERGIDFVRSKLKETAYASSIWDGGRLILLDEADGLTKQAQDSLKRIMERSTCWWILTCNDHSKIIPAIKSRCVSFNFKPYSVKQVRAYLQLLMKEEGVVAQDSAEALHSRFGGDLRAIGIHIASGKTLNDDQTNFDSLALSFAAGDWEDAHKTMSQMIRDGGNLHYVMSRIHEHVKSVGMSSQSLYAFFAVWGDFVLRMHEWSLSHESFVDYFVATLYNEDQKNKED